MSDSNKTTTSPLTSAPSNILILGATGNIGIHITRAILQAKSNFSHMSIFTSTKTANEKAQQIAEFESGGAKVYTGDISDEKAIKEVLRDAQIDTVVSCIGRGAIDKQIPIITWAEQIGVRRFFASEYGTDIEYSPASRHEPPHQQKIAVREHMKQCKTMEHTYVVTGPYSEFYFGPMKSLPEIGSFDVQKRRAYLLGDGNGSVSFTAMADVGKFVVAALLNYSASRNKTLIVHSFTTTPKEILAEFEAQTDQKWEVYYTSFDRLKNMEKEGYQSQHPMASAMTLRRIWTEGGTLYKSHDNELLGDPETQGLVEQVGVAIKAQGGGSGQDGKKPSNL